MPDEFPELFIDIGDPNKRGMYRSFDSEVSRSLGVIIRADGLPTKFRLGRRSESGLRPWDDVNITGATIEWAVGALDQPPASGQWAMTIDGSSTGLTALAHNISAADLETALNANAAMIARGGVDIEKAGAMYIGYMRDDNETPAIGLDVDSLFPQVAENPLEVIQTAAPDRNYIFSIQLAQAPYAYINEWDAGVTGAISVTERQAGTAVRNEIQRISFNVKPYEGNYLLNLSIPQTVDLTLTENTAAKYEALLVFPNASAINNKSFTLPGITPLVVWFNVDGAGTAPDTSGDLIPVPLTAADTASDVRDKTTAELGSYYTVEYFKGNTARIRSIIAGNYGNAVTENDAGVTATNVTLGTNGAMVGKGAVIYDSEGSVGIYITSNGEGTPDAAVSTARRVIPISVTPGATKSAAATAVAAALNPESEFDATAIGTTGVVKITQTFGGDREKPVAYGLGVQQTERGAQKSVSVPWDVTAAKLEKLVSPYFTVQERKNAFDLTSTRLGPIPAIEVDDTDLIYPNSLEAQLNLNTIPMHIAFGATDKEELELVFQGIITFPDKLPFTFYWEKVRVRRTVITTGTASPAVRAMLTGIGDGCSLVKDLSQSIPDTTPEKVTFASVLWDDDNFFDNANDRLIAPKAGRYAVGAQISGATSQWQLLLYKNGALHIMLANNYPADVGLANGYVELELAAADYVEIYAAQFAGIPRNIAAANTRFSIQRIK